jgi:hypothetical protein
MPFMMTSHQSVTTERMPLLRLGTDITPTTIKPDTMISCNCIASLLADQTAPAKKSRRPNRPDPSS